MDRRLRHCASEQVRRELSWRLNAEAVNCVRLGSRDSRLVMILPLVRHFAL